jgi:hypothetical protein
VYAYANAAWLRVCSSTVEREGSADVCLCCYASALLISGSVVVDMCASAVAE